MKDQYSFSCGLLYSIMPESLSTLHLNDDAQDEFDWLSDKSQLADTPFAQAILIPLKRIFAG